MIVGKNNVDANLREFAKRYNAIVEIYSNIDSLKANAVRLSMSALQNEISQWKAKKQSVCGSESEFRNQFNNSYERLKRDLNGYLGKIKPTVETVCSIYKTKATLSNGRIALCDGIYKAE